MSVASEYTIKPRYVLVHAPRQNQALSSLTSADTTKHNFAAVPDSTVLQTEFDALIDWIKQQGVEVIDIADVADAADVAALNNNPNSIFTRDPLITLPWAPGVAITARMTLSGRHAEPAINKAVARKLGVTQFFEPPEDAFIEGGDVYGVAQHGKRTLYVGIGVRTTMAAARWLAATLAEHDYIDEVVCLGHDRELLHLDTCFALLPKHTALCALDTLRSCIVIDKNGRETTYRPLDYLNTQGYSVLFTSHESAARDEACNMLAVGTPHYVSFQLPPTITAMIEQTAGVELHQIRGAEIAKANGGAHCLTRPIY